MPFDGTQFVPTTLVLIEAKRRVEDGWRQHSTGDGRSVCMLSALPRIRGAFHPEARSLLARVVGEYPAVWQDMTGRTKESVLAAYDRAIALSFQSE